MIINQFAIQKYWFGEEPLTYVLESYEIKDDKVREKVARILERSKKNFIKGFSFFTRESIDEEICEIISCMKQ